MYRIPCFGIIGFVFGYGISIAIGVVFFPRAGLHIASLLLGVCTSLFLVLGCLAGYLRWKKINPRSLAPLDFISIGLTLILFASHGIFIWDYTSVPVYFLRMIHSFASYMGR